jgi:predicted transposase YdaD
MQSRKTPKAPSSSDNICKLIAETYPEQVIEWLFGVSGIDARILKTEIFREPILADSVILLESDAVFHIEFQTTAKSDPPLPLRMLDYYVGLKRKFFDKRIRQVLVILKETGVDVPDRYQDERVLAVYDVVKMWEQDPSALLDHDGLLPLATLCRDEARGEKLLREVAQRLDDIDDLNRRANQIVNAQLLAGLRYSGDLVYQILRGGDMLEESSVYQDILRKGIQQGVQRGREEGREEGREVGEKHLVIRLLESRLGNLSLETTRRIETLTLDEVEELGVALLNFANKAELDEWLSRITGR